MPLSAGTRLGPYQTLAPIGTGGMGEVYRAHDPRMGRDVAVKISAERFSDRFSREVHVVAALNHPNICQLYDVGPNYLVMELVEGPTLAERIQQGPVPLEEALAIGKQIAEALEAAHEKGIVHRDLKPGNIKLRPDGAVKVLDFGLAKVDPSATSNPSPDREGSDDPDNSPTLTLEAATRLGTILGTAAYMSPEQARGKPVDKRADIWAFGCVLYEMLTGKRAFTGENTTDILSAVVKTEPDLTPVPANVRRLIESCLQKDPKQRLRDIGDAWKLLDDADTSPPRPRGTASRLGTRLSIGLRIAAAVLAVALIAVSWIAWRATRPVNHPLVRLDMDLGPEVALPNLGQGFANSHHVILSPDGTRLVYLSGNPRRLYMRRLDQSKATELPGTEDAVRPFFSPDGQWLGFFTGQDGTKLDKISVDGGGVVPLADLPSSAGGSWGVDGNIIVAGTKGLLQVGIDRRGSRTLAKPASRAA